MIQIEPGQMQAPKAWAKVDASQFRDGRLELRYRGQILRHKRYAYNDQLGAIKLADDKTVNKRVGQVLQRERKRLDTLAASIAHQASQRKAGIYTIDSPPNSPRTEATSYALRSK